MYWQTLVGSGVKYMSKVQLYRVSIFINIQWKCQMSSLHCTHTHTTQEVTCWNQLLSDEHFIIHPLLQWTVLYTFIITGTNITWPDELFTCSTEPFMYKVASSQGVPPSSVWSVTVWSKSGCMRNLNSCKCKCKFLDNENSYTHKRYKFKSQDKTMACYKHTYMLIRNVIILISFLMCGGWIPLNTLCSITSIRWGS